MTATLEQEATETIPDGATMPDDSAAPGPTPRPPMLLDLMTQAEREQPDPRVALLTDYAEILERADHPRSDDGRYLLTIADELHIDRKTALAGVEAVIAWRKQIKQAQAAVGKLETRQAELSREVEDLEAKRAALELDDGYAKLHALAVAGVAHLLQSRAPNLRGGFLNYQGWTSDQFGFNKGNYRNHPMQQAARRQWMELLGTDLARQIVADLARRNVARGGVADGCSIDQLVEADL